MSEAASLYRPTKHTLAMLVPRVWGETRGVNIGKKIKLCSEKTNYFPYLKVSKIKHHKEKCRLSVTCYSTRLTSQTETAQEIIYCTDQKCEKASNFSKLCLPGHPILKHTAFVWILRIVTLLPFQVCAVYPPPGRAVARQEFPQQNSQEPLSQN